MMVRGISGSAHMKECFASPRQPELSERSHRLLSFNAPTSDHATFDPQARTVTIGGAGGFFMFSIDDPPTGVPSTACCPHIVQGF